MPYDFWLKHRLEHKYEFSLHLPFSLVVLLHFIDSSSFEFFELLRDLTSDDDRIISSEVLCELLKCALDTMY
jgi:hypothetical protein